MHTLSGFSELRREERSEMMRESSEARRWRSASSSREVRETSNDAVSCNSLASSTSLETSPPTAGDSPGEFAIWWCWSSDQRMGDLRFTLMSWRGFCGFLSNYGIINTSVTFNVILGVFMGKCENGWSWLEWNASRGRIRCRRAQ